MVLLHGLSSAMTLIRRRSRSRQGVAITTILVSLASAAFTWAAAPAETPGRGRDITIIAGDDRIIYEIRQNGILRQIRVVPANGRPYFLVPADPTRVGQDLRTAGQLIPSWTLVTF